MPVGAEVGATSAPKSVWSLGAALGEGPVWIRRDQALWFVDIKGAAIHRYDPADGGKTSWRTPEQCGFVLPVAGGGFVAGLQSGLHRFDASAGEFNLIVDPEPDVDLPEPHEPPHEPPPPQPDAPPIREPGMPV